jgi:hypothetical protein
MDQCTQNYECLVISNNTQSNKLEDIVFWYKASLHGEFRIGDPRFWQHNATYYRDKEEEDINLYDPTRQTSTRKGPVIEVRKLE